jgi:AraC-like DNA-binding protein
MNQFSLQQGISAELALFPHIIEFAARKNQTIQLNSLCIDQKESLRIYHIIEGKFEWLIDDQLHTLYPGDTALILPGHTFGSEKEVLDIGAISWLDIKLDKFDSTGNMIPGTWSSLTPIESRTIGKILSLNNTPVLSRFKEAGDLFQHLSKELSRQEIGYVSRCAHLLDELLILIARQLTRRNNSYRDFPQTFMKLEQTLRENLEHQWTVAEMAALVGLGTTAFTEKVKSYTGFSPLNYLINIRISEAIRLLKRSDVNLTDIALDTGFYSSQHFSTTFKKLTGYTPSQFRKNNTQNK